MQHDAAIGDAIVECLAAILADFGVADLAELQRTVRDSPAAGLYMDFELHDGTYVGQKESRSRAPEFVRQVRRVGIGASVLGNDTEEVPPQRIDLLEFAILDAKDFATQAADRVRALLGEIEEAAIKLWNESAIYYDDPE